MCRFTIAVQGLSQPELDVNTRWNSTYTMLKKLLEFERSCEEHLEFTSNLTISDWSVVRSIVNLLEPVYITTVKLQSEQLYMGDFYKLWLELTLTIKAIQTERSTFLANCLQQREKSLIENHIVISSVYLDPRVRRALLQKPINLMYARSQLKKLMQQIYNVSHKRNNNTTISLSNTNSETASSSNPESTEAIHSTHNCSLLDEFLSSIEVASSDEDDDRNEDLNNAMAEIDNYNPKPIDLNTDIMKYWEEKNMYIHIYVYQLAKVVHSVPATQVSVERSFSALKLVLTD